MILLKLMYLDGKCNMNKLNLGVNRCKYVQFSCFFHNVGISLLHFCAAISKAYERGLRLAVPA